MCEIACMPLKPELFNPLVQTRKMGIVNLKYIHAFTPPPRVYSTERLREKPVTLKETCAAFNKNEHHVDHL